MSLSRSYFNLKPTHNSVIARSLFHTVLGETNYVFGSELDYISRTSSTSSSSSSSSLSSSPPIGTRCSLYYHSVALFKITFLCRSNGTSFAAEINYVMLRQQFKIEFAPKETLLTHVRHHNSIHIFYYIYIYVYIWLKIFKQIYG